MTFYEVIDNLIDVLGVPETKRSGVGKGMPRSFRDGTRLLSAILKSLDIRFYFAYALFRYGPNRSYIYCSNSGD